MLFIEEMAWSTSGKLKLKDMCKTELPFNPGIVSQPGNLTVKRLFILKVKKIK